MAELEQVLGAMNQINDRMLIVVRMVGEERNRQIVQLRQEFATATGNLITLLPGERRLAARPQVFSEFQDRLSVIRRKLASHQAKWSIEDINQRRGDYLTSTKAIHDSIAEYLSWARGALRPH
jgi:hydroxypyruvate isomerase